jgi:hypothetical protein
VCFNSSSQSSSNAENKTTVNVSTTFAPSVDTKGVQDAINALAGNTTAAQLAMAAAIAQSAATNAASVKALGVGLASFGGGNARTQIIVAIIGLVGVLIAAHVLKVPKIKV